MADGESEGVIERLVVEWDATTDKILGKLNDVVSKNRRAAHEVESDWAKVDVGKALDKVFDSSKLAVLDAGAEHLRIFGSALEPLGPLGIGAAAAIAALGLALEKGHEALEFAEGLEKAAQKLGISTTKLQEYDFLAIKSGVSTEAFREALQRGSVAFGAFISGVGDAKVKKAFEAIGLTPEQGRQFKDFDAALPAIADKIKAVGNAAEQNKLAKMLGLEEMLPALRQGGDYIKGMEEEAHRLGLVLDAGAVKSAAEMAGKMKVAGDQVKTNLTRAFLELAPIVLGITNMLAKWARFVGDTAENLANTKGFLGLGGVNYAGLSEDHLARSALSTQKEMNAAADDVRRTGGKIDAHGHADNNGSTLATSRYNQMRNQYLALGEAWAAKTKADAAIDKSETTGGAAKQLGFGKTPKTRRGPRDDSSTLTEEAARALDDAAKAGAEAMKAFTGNVQKRADLEKAAIADELKKQGEEISAREAKITADKGITAAKKKELLATEEEARFREYLTAIVKSEKVDRDAAFALEDKEIEVSRSIYEAKVEQLKAEAEMAPTAAARAKIERELLQFEQQRARDETETKRDRAVVEGSLTPEQRDTQNAADQRRDASAMQAESYKATYAGVHGALEAAVKGGWGGLAKYMADKLETNLLDVFSNFLTNMLVGSGSGGGLNGGLLGAIFGGLIPGFASGTDNAPGGVALVGEKGPELVNLPGGSVVTPNNRLQNLGVQRGMAMNVSNISFDLRGAVMTDDLLAQMNGLAAAAEQRATMNGAVLGAQAARATIPAEMNRRASLQIR